MLDKWKGRRREKLRFQQRSQRMRNIHHMNLVEGIEEKEISQAMHRRDIKDDRGTRLMFYTVRHQGLLEEIEDQKKF